MKITQYEKNLLLSEYGDINLPITLDCGQAFRWSKAEDDFWLGTVKGTEVKIRQTDKGLEFHGITKKQLEEIFIPYFDFTRDYKSIIKSFEADNVLKNAIESYGTIRILKQDEWETLCSFIISACNNIPRIKSIISKLCESFGEKLNSTYSFPSAEKIASLKITDLDVLKAGYRREYIYDAAQKIASGEINLKELKNTDIDSARKELMKIKGVGKKVADCTLLFGLGFIDSFPIDRHIKRITYEYYPNGLPECIKDYEGIAQQYMFHIQRTEVTSSQSEV